MSDKTLKKREYILNGNLLKVILMITAPLALYAIFNYLYGIIDLALVLPGERAQVVFYDEMKTAITAFGAGIATAGSVIVGRLYGAGDIANARKNAGVTLWLNIIICTAIAVVVMAVAPFFFNVIKISDNILDGISYFYVQIITTIAMAVTATFVGMEKVKGNTLLIFLLNIGAMVIKILLTILLVNVLHLRATFAAVSTLIAQVILMSVALVLMFKKSNILRVEWKDSKLKKEFVVPILVLSIPIFIGKFLFSIGKVFITIIAESHYSDDAISAFGVMSKIASVFGNVAMTFEEGQSSIISVNIGNKNLRRAVLSYPISVSISVGIGIIGIVVSTIFSSFFMGIFLKPEDSVEYVNMVYQLFLYERWSTITNAVIGITVSAFIGFKKSLMSTIINVLRIFILRIPVLLICIYAIKMDYHSLGVAMFVSNTLTAIIAVGCLLFYLLKIRKHGYNGIAYYPNLKAPLTEDSSIK